MYQMLEGNDLYVARSDLLSRRFLVLMIRVSKWVIVGQGNSINTPYKIRRIKEMW